MHAVECLRVWKTMTDGSQTITTTKTQVVKVTSKHNWPAYNAAQTEETARFLVLLHALCALIDQPGASEGPSPLAPGCSGLCMCLYGLCGLFRPAFYEGLACGTGQGTPAPHAPF